MKRPALLLICCLVGLSSCMHPYVIKETNGLQITTPNKPKLENGEYHYKDGYGHDYYVPAGRVREIEPLSMAADEQKQFVPPKFHKKRHWYLLWLG